MSMPASTTALVKVAVCNHENLLSICKVRFKNQRSLVRIWLLHRKF